MPAKLKSQWIVPFVAVVALLVLPAAAQATLVYIAQPDAPGRLRGSRQRFRRAQGRSRSAAPGSLPTGSRSPTCTKAPSARTGTEAGLRPAEVAPAALMVGWQDSFYLAFSPDSTTIAALRGPEVGKRKLVLIDLATGSQRTVASGYFSGFSFSPEGDELAYAKAGSEQYPPRSDVFQRSRSAAAGKPVQITHDHNSQNPLWGPAGKIVFVKLLGAKQRRYGPKNELYLMSPSGSQVKRLTHTKVGSLLQGLFPTELVGQRQPAADRVRGPGHELRGHGQSSDRRPEAAEEDGTASRASSAPPSRADGKTVLGFTGGFDPVPTTTPPPFPIRAASPKARRNAFEPDSELLAGTGSVQQADLAQDRDAVGVDVLALDQAVLEGESHRGRPTRPACRSARR